MCSKLLNGLPVRLTLTIYLLLSDSTLTADTFTDSDRDCHPLFVWDQKQSASNNNLTTPACKHPYCLNICKTPMFLINPPL